MLGGNTVAEESEVNIGSFEMTTILEAVPDVSMEELSEVGADLGYDHLVIKARVEVFEDEEAFSVMDILEEDITAKIEEAEEISDITNQILKELAPETLKVGVINMQEILEADSQTSTEKITEIAADLGYDYVVMEARLKVFEDEEAFNVTDLQGEDITDVIESQENFDTITDKIIDEF